jgi:hypothetical protein
LKGDKKKFYAMLPRGFVNEKTEPAFSGNFYSDFRDMALVLNTLLEVDPQNTQINYMAKQVAQTLQTQAIFKHTGKCIRIFGDGQNCKSSEQRQCNCKHYQPTEKIAKFDGKKEVVLNSAV